MKYNIEFKCGHNEEVALFGSFKDREREIERLQECNCSACRKLSFQKQMSAEYDEVSVKKDSSDDIKKDEAADADKETVAGVRMIDAEDLSWQLAEITKERVVKYMHTHNNVTMVPLEMVLEIIDNTK